MMFRPKSAPGSSAIVQPKSSKHSPSVSSRRESRLLRQAVGGRTSGRAGAVQYLAAGAVTAIDSRSAARGGAGPETKTAAGGHAFREISAPAVAKLRGRGAQAVVGEVSCLPFADSSFDLVCAFDIIEHVDDDDGALSEVSRTPKRRGGFEVAPSYGAVDLFDDFVGHRRRSTPPSCVEADAASPDGGAQGRVRNAAGLVYDWWTTVYGGVERS